MTMLLDIWPSLTKYLPDSAQIVPGYKKLYIDENGNVWSKVDQGYIQILPDLEGKIQFIRDGETIIENVHDIYHSAFDIEKFESL